MTEKITTLKEKPRLKKEGKPFYNWLASPLGQLFLEQEAKELLSLIHPLYGNNILCLGESPFLSGVNKSKLTDKIWLHPTQAVPYEHGSVICGRPDKLPIGDHEIDIVYLAHYLGSVQNPHEVLRESYRVLAPEGHVVISGFNPWSLWGLKRFFGFLAPHWPWNTHFLSVARLKDWLALLGFQWVSVRFYFFRPPFAAGLKKLQWMEGVGNTCWPIFGGHYLILAKKRVIPLTVFRPVWRPKAVKVEGLVGPAF